MVDCIERKLLNKNSHYVQYFYCNLFNIFTNLTNVHTLLVCRTSYDHDYVFYDYRYVDTKKDDVALSLSNGSNIETLN